jgi:hypothetical protein
MEYVVGPHPCLFFRSRDRRGSGVPSSFPGGRAAALLAGFGPDVRGAGSASLHSGYHQAPMTGSSGPDHGIVSPNPPDHCNEASLPRSAGASKRESYGDPGPPVPAPLGGQITYPPSFPVFEHRSPARLDGLLQGLLFDGRMSMVT